MNVIDVRARNGECEVTTTEGRFTRWPGKLVNGHAWWSYLPGQSTGRPTLVTVPRTVADLEALHHAATFALSDA